MRLKAVWPAFDLSIVTGSQIGFRHWKALVWFLIRFVSYISEWFRKSTPSRLLKNSYAHNIITITLDLVLQEESSVSDGRHGISHNKKLHRESIAIVRVSPLFSQGVNQLSGEECLSLVWLDIGFSWRPPLGCWLGLPCTASWTASWDEVWFGWHCHLDISLWEMEEKVEKSRAYVLQNML